jgi:hypothetical protein
MRFYKSKRVESTVHETWHSHIGVGIASDNVRSCHNGLPDTTLSSKLANASQNCTLPVLVSCRTINLIIVLIRRLVAQTATNFVMCGGMSSVLEPSKGTLENAKFMVVVLLCDTNLDISRYCGPTSLIGPQRGGGWLLRLWF